MPMKKSSKIKKRKQYTKDELIMIGRGTSFATNMKVQMLLTIGVLWDVFNFSEEDINEFVDRYHEMLDSYNAGNEDIETWAKNIEELTGIKIEV